VTDVLNAEVDALLNVAIANDLIHDDTDGSRGYVIDDASTTVVVFVGHTLLLCSISLDINNVSYAVVDKEGRQFNGAMVLEATLEHVARTRAVTE